MRHTAKPWIIKEGSHYEIRSADGKIPIARTWAGHDPPTYSFSYAERIVACVNACAGINPEAIPELIEACHAIVSDINEAAEIYGDRRVTAYLGESTVKLKAALSKAIGEGQ